MKKGFELSITFLVMLIIAIVVFALGIRFAYNLFKIAPELIDPVLEPQLEEEVTRCLGSGNIVCIPKNQKEIAIKKTEIFGLGILNQMGEEMYFKVFTDFATAVDEHGDVFDDDVLNNIDVTQWTFAKSSAYKLNNNEQEILPLAFEVPLGTKKGTYVFNVGVYYSDSEDVEQDNLYDTVHQIRIIVK